MEDMVEIAESASDDLNTSVGDRDQVAKQDEGHVATEVVRGVGWIRLINPHRANALTPAMIAELADAWRAFDADPSVSVIMLTGHGDRHFCAGSDVRKLAESTVYGSHEYKVEWPSPRIVGVRKPVVSVINGSCAAGALSFVTDADIVLASRNARFTDSHAAIGQVSGYSILRLAVRVSYTEAARLALGRELSAERAYQLGMVSELYETPGEAREAAQGLGDRIVALSPAAAELTLRGIREIDTPPHEETALKRAMDAIRSHRLHPDSLEGARAMTEHRPARWKREV
jgi:E-phenylitaconyl-CoA hydratase